MTDRDQVLRAVAAGRPAQLNGAQLAGVDLSGLDLSGADLSYADLATARLDGASLRRARLWSAQARGASLVGCDLRDADLRTADLAGADLRRADLRGARVTGTTLTGARLDGAHLPEDPGGAVTSPAPGAGGPGPEVGARHPGSSGGRAHVVVREADDGAEVALGRGGVLEVELPEGPTGYRWVPAPTDEGVLSGPGDRFDPPGGLGEPAPGAFGRRVFRFTAAAPGAAAVSLRLVQPWDVDAPAARVFTVRVRVS